ncbi:unnamed protein product [Linum trigynum]|uniref:Uncharacterized protein n=1 Tax=Linum trigynum TaxID=586398 RepID=A0AAV2F4R9_9ROSI
MGVLPQAYPTSMSSMLKRPGGCNPPGGHAEGHGSLPPDKVKCQVGGQDDFGKTGEMALPKSTPRVSSKCGKGSMSPTISSGLTIFPKKLQQAQSTCVSSKSTSVTQCGKGGMSVTMNNGMGCMSPYPCSGQGGMSSYVKKRVRGNSKSVRPIQATQKLSKYESVLRDGQRSKSMFNSPHGIPNMNGRQEGMNKTSRHATNKHGPTKDQRLLAATCRSQ